MLRHAISHGRLMRESTDRVQAALSSSDRNEQLIARRIPVHEIIHNCHSALVRLRFDGWLGRLAQWLARLVYTE